jgi:DHA2 family multidrug resistance protein
LGLARRQLAATLLQGTGLGMLLPSLGKVAFSALGPEFLPEGTALLSLSWVYGRTIGIGVVQILFYSNTRAMHLALANNLTPFRTTAHLAGSITKPSLAALDGMITHQAAGVAVIDQFKILILATLTVSPLVFFLRKPRPTH